MAGSFITKLNASVVLSQQMDPHKIHTLPPLPKDAC